MGVDTSQIPAVYVVINGPLEMSPGKIAAQTFQACQRLHASIPLEHFGRVRDWGEHTTTIARIATTPTVWERVKAEVDGRVMVDEGYTEVEPGSETCFASWPLLRDEVPKILSNAKCPLYTHDLAQLQAAFLAGLELGAGAATDEIAVGSSELVGNSEQETRELRAKAFRGWAAEALA